MNSEFSLRLQSIRHCSDLPRKANWEFYSACLNKETVFVRKWTGNNKDEFKKYTEILNSLVGKKIPGYANIHEVDEEYHLVISEFVALSGEGNQKCIPEDKRQQKRAPTLANFLAERGKLSPAASWIILTQIVATARALKNIDPDKRLHLHLDLHPTNMLIEDEKALLVRVVDLKHQGMDDETELLYYIGRFFYFLLTGDKTIFKKDKGQYRKEIEKKLQSISANHEILDILEGCDVLQEGKKYKTVESLWEQLCKLTEIPQKAYSLPPVFTYGFFYSVVLFLLASFLCGLVSVAGYQNGLTLTQAIGWHTPPTFTATPDSESILPDLTPRYSPTTTPTSTATPLPTTTPTPTETHTPTPTVTHTATTTSTSTPTSTPSSTPTPSPFPSPSPSPTLTFTPAPTHNPTPIPAPTPIIPRKTDLLPPKCIPNKASQAFYFETPDGTEYFKPGDIQVHVENFQYLTIRYARVDDMPASREWNDWPAIWQCSRDEHGVRCQHDVTGNTMIIPLSEWYWTDKVVPPQGRDYYLLLEVERPQGTKTEILCTYVYVPPK